MTHTHTTKLSLIGMIVVGLFLFGLTIPAHAAEGDALSGGVSIQMHDIHASTTTRLTASSTRERGDRNGGMRKHNLHSSSTNATSTREQKGNRGGNIDATCVQSAVDVRETALASAWSTFTSSITSALGTRKTALHDAWGATDIGSRNTALMNAWKTWQMGDKSAHEALKMARKAAWETFMSTAKGSCKVQMPQNESLGGDGKGSISL